MNLRMVNWLMKRRQRNAQGGFSLIEVMVALIVICVGLLGIAKMQALSLSNTNNSRMRALAAIQAASLASAMHSNRQYWANVPPPVPPNFNASLANGVLASSDAALTAALAATTQTACMNTQCNSTALAAFDLTRWGASMVGLLPNPSATVSCPVAAGGIGPTSCTIQINWTENTVSINAQSNAVGGQYQTPTYVLYVEP